MITASFSLCERLLGDDVPMMTSVSKRLVSGMRALAQIVGSHALPLNQR